MPVALTVSALSSTQAKHLQRDSQNTCFLVFKDAQSLQKKINDFLKKWQVTPTDNFKKNLKDFKLEKTDRFKALTLHFSEGGSLYFVVLAKELSAFHRQTAIRGNLSGAVKASIDGQLCLWLGDCPSVLHEQICGEMISFCHNLMWEIPKTTNAKKKESKDDTIQLSVHSKITPAKLKALSARASELALANNSVRELAETPPNILSGKTYIPLIKKRAQSLKNTKFEFWNASVLKQKKAGAFLSVGAAHDNENVGIAKLSYRPAKAKKHLALVGKGICFDTGGYNAKPGDSMRGMKRDMTGSAIALSLFEMLVKLKFPHKVDCYLAISENHISPKAFKMDDVVVASDGTSIEIIHTDAEGRMVLADTLAFVRKTNPDLTVDFATLTGAAHYCTDSKRGSIFANRDDLLTMGVEAGVKSGERCNSYPIGDDYMDPLKKSTVADIYQCNPERNADHIYAATFLSHFIGDENPWIHLDLSADTTSGGLGLISTETTGFGPRWSLALIEKYFRVNL